MLDTKFSLKWKVERKTPKFVCFECFCVYFEFLLSKSQIPLLYNAHWFRFLGFTTE